MVWFWKTAAAAPVLLLFAHGAWAGHYALRDTDAKGAFKNPYGGKVVEASSTTHYEGNSDNYGGTAHGNGTVSCSGKITTIFDWKRDPIADPDNPGQMIDDPSDAPPLRIIVKEHCTASYSASDGVQLGSASGSCDNGLGFVKRSASPSRQSAVKGGLLAHPNYFAVGGVSRKSDGTRYKEEDGGETVTITCSPTAQASGSGCDVSVSYSVAITPLSIDFLGLTRDGKDLKFLTGQKITASLNSELTAAYPTGPRGQTWTTDGAASAPGNTASSIMFRDYQETRTSQQFIKLTDGDMKKPNFIFYTFDNGSIVLKCDAELVFPEDSTDAPVKVVKPLPKVSVTAKTIISVRPTNIRWQVENGVVRGDTTPISDLFGYMGVIGSAYLNGQDWHDVNVTVPAPFEGQGQCCFVQLINADRTLERVVPPSANPNAAAVYEKDPFNALECLDSSFPYNFAMPIQWNVSRQRGGRGFDSPQQKVSVPDRDNGGMDWRRAVAVDSMETWLMYMPPSKDRQRTIWIPMASYTWGWNGTAEKKGPLDSQSNQPSWILTDSSTPPTDRVMPKKTTKFPEWIRFSPSPFSLVPRH